MTIYLTLEKCYKQMTKTNRDEIPSSGHKEQQWTITEDSFVLSV